MDCDGSDCDGCAVCATLIMGGDDAWEPTYLVEFKKGRCVFCQQTGRLAYYTRLGMPVGFCCCRR
jgi:hypothetical protein